MRSSLGKVQDRSVAAEGNDHIGAAQLLLQRFDRQSIALRAFLVLKRQAHDIWAACLIQHLLRLLGNAQLRITVRVGTQDYLFQHHISSFPWSSA